jgi:hypothetical protein
LLTLLALCNRLHFFTKSDADQLDVFWIEIAL